MIETSPSYRELLSGAPLPFPAFDPRALMVFVHLPKTAGSGFTHFLLDTFHSPFEITWNALDRRTEVLAAGDTGPHDLAYGHIRWRHVERLRDSPRRFRLVSFVRDPVDRAISHYRYCRSPEHPPHEEFREEFPTLDAYIEKGRRHWAEHFAYQLVGGATSVDELIGKAEKLYSFIGVTEAYELSLYLFCLAFELPFQPPQWRTNTAAERPADGVVVTDAHRQALAEGCPVDCGFHRHVLDRYRARAPELFARLASEVTALRNQLPQPSP